GQRPRGTRRGLEDSAQCLVSRLRVVLLVFGEVGLPRLLVPNLQEVHRTDDRTVAGEVGVPAMFGRQHDPALRIQPLFVGSRRQRPDECPRLRIAPGCRSSSPGERTELFLRIDGQAVVLSFGDHQPSRQIVSKLRGQRESPLVVQPRCVSTEKQPRYLLPDHLEWCRPAGPAERLTTSPVVRAPHYPTFPHFQSKHGVMWLPGSRISQVTPAITGRANFSRALPPCARPRAQNRTAPVNFQQTPWSRTVTACGGALWRAPVGGSGEQGPRV